MCENAYLSIKNPKASRALKRALDPGRRMLASLTRLRFAMSVTFSLRSWGPPLDQILDLHLLRHLKATEVTVKILHWLMPTSEPYQVREYCPQPLHIKPAAIQDFKSIPINVRRRTPVERSTLAFKPRTGVTTSANKDVSALPPPPTKRTNDHQKFQGQY